MRWAETITERARERAKDERDTRIIELKAEGKSNRQIARDVGLSHQTVARVEAGPKPNASQMDHPEPSPAAEKQARNHAAVLERLDEMDSPAARAWHAALMALREINKLAPVDDLFAGRYARLDQALRPELAEAFAWIKAFHRRFEDERNQRRRA